MKWAVLGGVLLLLAVWKREELAQLALAEVEVERVVARDPSAVAAATGASANGYIVARTRAALSADTPGRIVELNVTEGSVVKRGEVVARLYSEEYAAALRRAEADVAVFERGVEVAAANVEAARSELDTLRAYVAAARADLASAEASQALAQLTFDRAVKLLESGVDTVDRRDRAQRDLLEAQALLQGATARLEASQRSLLQGEARLAAAELGVAEARARVAAAVAARELAAATLDKTAVRAPFDGVVVLKDAEVGEVVSPNSQGGSNARGSVVTMVDFATLEVQAEVPETSLASVALGAEARIYLDAAPSKAYPGRVDRIWPTANRTKATVEVRVAFLERDQELRPEMGVRVVFAPPAPGASGASAADGGSASPALPPEARILVPLDCVARADGKSYVWLHESGVVRRRDVELGLERAGRVAVLAGLAAGEEIVRKPAASLADGQRVRVAGAGS
ncbi:MAG: efflux RND transporter periplasmic adaptor subunit [Planctomycetes bacterium]|nr:efflux RND transporter periplasmic adaptor subunit [Planctomycetota bacterium]